MIKCNICGCAEFTDEFIVTRQDKYKNVVADANEAASYKLCNNCEVMYYSGNYDFNQIYHDNSYYSVDYSNTNLLERRFNNIVTLPADKSDNSSRVERIKSFCELKLPSLKSEQKYKVLDIGAGLGVFLYSFLNQSWEGWAIEPDPAACQLVSKKLPKVQIFKGYSNEIYFNHSFDLITMNRVLEHISDPKKILVEQKRNLKENCGYFYIELPSTDSYFMDGINNEAFGYGHYNIYSEKSLEFLAKACGFTMHLCKKVVEPSGKYTIYCFLSNGS